MNSAGSFRKRTGRRSTELSLPYSKVSTTTDMQNLSGSCSRWRVLSEILIIIRNKLLNKGETTQMEQQKGEGKNPFAAQPVGKLILRFAVRLT